MTTIHVDIMTAYGDRYYDSFTFQHGRLFGNLMEELTKPSAPGSPPSPTARMYSYAWMQKSRSHTSPIDTSS